MAGISASAEFVYWNTLDDINEEDTTLTESDVETQIGQFVEPWISDLVSGQRIMETHRPANSRQEQSHFIEDTRRMQGCLQLGVYVNYGMLTVHVMKGRNLQSDSSTKCNSVVKLCLVPDEENITACRTQVNLSSNSPNYDEKFSFEVVEQDANRRLLIAVWHIADDQTTSEFLGCMSFGLKHILRQNKTIQGWYHLLERETGQRKHLHVTAAPRQPKLIMAPPSRMPQQKAPMRKALQQLDTNIRDYDDESENSENVWTDCIQIVVKRGLGGFGFSISGQHPVEVCTVDPMSSAEYAGLRIGDQIMTINGLSVMNASTQDVAAMVRHRHSHCLILEIQRPYGHADLQNISQLSTKTCISSATATTSAYANVRSLHQHHQMKGKHKLKNTLPVSSSTPTQVSRQSSFTFFKKPSTSKLRRYESDISIANSIGSVSMLEENKSKKQKFKNFANNLLGRHR